MPGVTRAGADWVGKRLGTGPGGEEGGEFRIVGTPLPRLDALAKVTGSVVYADDLSLPGTLVCTLVRSPHPHARVLSVDARDALELPGVVAVLTGEALPTRFGILPVSQDERALEFEKVRYVGDPVAAVAALDEETARAACRLIRVAYEPLAAVTSIEQALEEPADEPIHDEAEAGNIHRMAALEFGDVEEGFAAADLVREDVFFYEGSTHLSLEEHSATATFADGQLTLRSSTQTPHYVQRALTKVLDLPVERIRVVATPHGGGFGGKSDPFAHELVVSKLAMITGRPVKCTLTREEVFYAHRGRHPVLMWVRTGVTREGRILAMHFRTALDGGAYGSFGVATMYYTGALQPVTYDLPAYRFEACRVFTNKAPCGPKRGHGTPQPRFALELHLDKIAEDLGMHAVELKRLNYVKPDSRTVNGLRITSCGIDEVTEKALEASGFHQRERRHGHGQGFAILRVPLRRRLPHLRQPPAPQRGQRQGRPCRRHGVQRRHRYRPGFRLDHRHARRRGARPVARGHPPRDRRHRPHPGRPRLVLLAASPSWRATPRSTQHASCARRSSRPSPPARAARWPR